MPQFIVISSPGKIELKSKELGDSHLDYLRKLKQEGKLEIAGRFTDGSGGLYILNASNLAEAEGMAERDPYNSSGYRIYTIKGWERRV
jgi:uncharacterized protein YciI